MKENLAKEKRYYEEMVGIAENQSNEIIDFDDLMRNLKIEQKKVDEKQYFEIIHKLSK
jgi:hypothetical protein